MLKTPKTKNLKEGAVQVAAVAAGAMLSRGAAVSVTEMTGNSTTAKAAIAIGSLVASEAYKGPQKDIVRGLLQGMAILQTVDLVSEQAQKSITKKPDANAIEKFGYAALGLGCPGDCRGNYPALGMPQDTIQQITWDRVYQPGTEEAEYAEIGTWTGN